MPRSRTYSGLSDARSNTAAQLQAVVSTLARMQTGGLGTSYGGLRDSTASEALTLLRQMVRLLAIIQASQSVAGAASARRGAGIEAGQSGDGGGFFGTFLGAISKGLGVAAIVSGIVGLFRGRHEPESVPMPFSAPNPISLEVANTDQILRGFPRFDSSAGGDPRLVESAASGATPLAPAPPDTAGAPAAQPVQITVNVNAMDARSFRDRAPELAEAVRDAMLHLHPINQVIRDWM